MRGEWGVVRIVAAILPLFLFYTAELLEVVFLSWRNAPPPPPHTTKLFACRLSAIMWQNCMTFWALLPGGGWGERNRGARGGGVKG